MQRCSVSVDLSTTGPPPLRLDHHAVGDGDIGGASARRNTDDGPSDHQIVLSHPTMMEPVAHVTFVAGWERMPGPSILRFATEVAAVGAFTMSAPLVER